MEKKPSYPKRKAPQPLKKEAGLTSDEDEAQKDRAPERGLQRKMQNDPRKGVETSESDQLRLYRHSASAPRAQQLTLTSSSTLHRPRSLGVKSAQAISPLDLSARSLAAHFDELDYSAQATQPRSQISSGYIANKASTPGAQ